MFGDGTAVDAKRSSHLSGGDIGIVGDDGNNILAGCSSFSVHLFCPFRNASILHTYDVF